MTLTAGTRLGPYEVVAPLGAGGMGEVYRARDPRLGRDIAIKILPELSLDRRQRFEQEARAVAALSHPNVISVFDIGGGEQPFLVTELLEGDTVRALIEHGPLAVSQAVHLALQLVAGLAAAHDRGIVHRDLKPENLFVTRDGRLKILDFGLAKLREPAGDLTVTALTRPGVVLGTIGYMAPEQIRGLNTDARADIFAFGAILYEMLTARRAFTGPSGADVLAAVLHEPAANLTYTADTPSSLRRVIDGCLQKDPASRYQSARELALALESTSDVRGPVVMTTPAAEHTSVAVLPFVNLTANADNQYFSDGLAEDLITALARLSGLRVAAPTSSFRFRSRDVDIRQVGHDLGVQAILDGSVRRSGERLRITTRLVDVATGYQLWSDRYDRYLTDVFDIQDDIVEAIVHAIAPTLVPAARAATRRATRNLDAYELYLKGRYFWNQRSPAVLQHALRCFEQAADLDPDYALAYCGLADCYTILHVYGWMPPAQCRPRAHDAVTKALALEPGLPEAHLSRALYVFHFERHWRQARQSFIDALTARPRMAAAQAQFAVFLATAFEFGEARERIGRALDTDPHASAIHFLAASAACLAADWEAAERHSARALELQPESLGAQWPRTIALLATGRMNEAIAAAEMVVARSRAPIYVGVMGMVYGRAGRLDDARRLAQELDDRRSRGEYIVPAAYLSVQLGLGNLPGVRDALAACIEGGAAPMSTVAPTRFLLDNYRTDSAINTLLDRLHDQE